MSMLNRLLKSIAVAFSMYSKIPMPGFEWDSEDMKYHLCFFPLIGAVIGWLEFGWYALFKNANLGIESVLYYGIALALPLLVTGGFHLDGFMDTADALSSWGNREKKLEILKDPHVGAFSVISLLVLTLVSVGFLTQIDSKNAVVAVCCSFFISRTLSGLSVLCFPKAKKEGMLYTESKTDGKKTGSIILFVEFLIGTAILIWLTLPHGLHGIFVLCAITLNFAYFKFMSKKQFGGVTGDLCGFFVTTSEVSALCASGIYCIIEGIL